MRFKNFINEEAISDKVRKEQEKTYARDIKKAKVSLSKIHKVDPKFLEFAYFQEYKVGNKKFGDYLFFNIEDQSHPNYGSSVGYQL